MNREKKRKSFRFALTQNPGEITRFSFLAESEQTRILRGIHTPVTKNELRDLEERLSAQ